MQIVIDIPENTVNAIKDNAMFAKPIADQIQWDVTSAIINGTPLPKGHGRLIDEDELKKVIQENDVLHMRGFNVRICDINNTPTIIEADNHRSR